MFRGCMAAEHPVAEEAVNEVLTKRGVPEGPGEREELQNTVQWAQERFGGGDVEPIIPIRSNLRKTFQGVVDRARQRRREIGAFLRGLDMGHTETSHMDAHGEASLQSLMEWAARLENLVENLTETPEMNQAHYTQFHRVLDQLEATTEALVIDVEQTLRRLRDRLEH
jgi:translation elongation factor EF-G